MSFALLFALSLLGISFGSCEGVNELLTLGASERIESAGRVDLLIILVLHAGIDKGVGPILALSSLDTERLQAPLGINIAVDTYDPALIKDEAWLRSVDVDVLEALLDANAERLERTASGPVVNEPRFPVAIPIKGSDEMAVVAVDAFLPMLRLGFEIRRGR